jgi:serine/threonine-protein kinase
LTLGRDVALKTLTRLTAAGADHLTREAQLMAQTTHQALATIHGVETWQGTPVLVMELLEGGTLASRISAGPLSCEDAVTAVLKVVECLAHLHQRHLLHRDIKPSNIGFAASGHLKLLDFGLAAALQPAAGGVSDASALGAQSGVAGTPLYLPPEAFEGKTPNPAFDLWGAALVLYEAVAGRHPYNDSESIAESIVHVRAKGVPDIRRFRADCPARLAVFLRNALALTVADRPRTAVEFLDALVAASSPASK